MKTGSIQTPTGSLSSVKERMSAGSESLSEGPPGGMKKMKRLCPKTSTSGSLILKETDSLSHNTFALKKKYLKPFLQELQRLFARKVVNQLYSWIESLRT
jgi:hypothetical protein